MNVSLTPELEKLVEDKVKSGLYNSASEVVREALRLLKEQDDLKRLRLEELRREVQIGLDQLERGEYTVYANARDLIDDIKAQAQGQSKLTKSTP
jgi:antitoxin ParD1/3/4